MLCDATVYLKVIREFPLSVPCTVICVPLVLFLHRGWGNLRQLNTYRKCDRYKYRPSGVCAALMN